MPQVFGKISKVCLFVCFGSPADRPKMKNVEMTSWKLNTSPLRNGWLVQMIIFPSKMRSLMQINIHSLIFFRVAVHLYLFRHFGFYGKALSSGSFFGDIFPMTSMISRKNSHNFCWKWMNLLESSLKNRCLNTFWCSFCGLHGNAPWLASSNVGGIDVCHILEKNDIDSPKNRRGSQILKNSLLEH